MLRWEVRRSAALNNYLSTLWPCSYPNALIRTFLYEYNLRSRKSWRIGGKSKYLLKPFFIQTLFYLQLCGKKGKLTHLIALDVGSADFSPRRTQLFRGKEGPWSEETRKRAWGGLWSWTGQTDKEGEDKRLIATVDKRGWVRTGGGGEAEGLSNNSDALPGEEGLINNECFSK